MFSFLDLAAILLTLSALFGWLNHKFIPLPHTIGLLVMSVVVSLILVGIDIVTRASICSTHSPARCCRSISLQS